MSFGGSRVTVRSKVTRPLKMVGEIVAPWGQLVVRSCEMVPRIFTFIFQLGKKTSIRVMSLLDMSSHIRKSNMERWTTPSNALSKSMKATKTSLIYKVGFFVVTKRRLMSKVNLSIILIFLRWLELSKLLKRVDNRELERWPFPPGLATNNNNNIVYLIKCPY